MSIAYVQLLLYRSGANVDFQEFFDWATYFGMRAKLFMHEKREVFAFVKSLTQVSRPNSISASIKNVTSPF